MEFNTEKCRALKFSKSGMRPDCEYKLGNSTLQECEKEKDLGVVINNRLSREEHIQEELKKIDNLLSNLGVAFTYIDEEIVKTIITLLVTCLLENSLQGPVPILTQRSAESPSYMLVSIYNLV